MIHNVDVGRYRCFVNIRPHQVHVNNCVVDSGNDKMMKDELLPASKVLYCIQQEHVAALAEVSILGNQLCNQLYNDIDEGYEENTWCPLWVDVIAVYLIEKIILHIYESYWHRDSSDDFSSVVLQLNSPYAIFDPYWYVPVLFLYYAQKSKEM
jgi:hypothetical protein